jgi:hypothetical protein
MASGTERSSPRIVPFLIFGPEIESFWILLDETHPAARSASFT